MIVDKGSFHKTFPFLHKYILEDHQSAKIVLFQKVYGLDNFFRCNLQKNSRQFVWPNFFPISVITIVLCSKIISSFPHNLSCQPGIWCGILRWIIMKIQDHVDAWDAEN